MSHVTGIGGFFFRSKDPDALGKWYQDHLGVPAGHTELFMQQAGPTVFAPFKEASDYFAADKRWMINLRVTDLKGLIGKLKAEGIAVETRAEWDNTDYGSFARIHDPEGNPIELWEEPKGE